MHGAIETCDHSKITKTVVDEPRTRARGARPAESTGTMIPRFSTDSLATRARVATLVDNCERDD
jgi:hypothetical protein